MSDGANRIHHEPCPSCRYFPYDHAPDCPVKKQRDAQRDEFFAALAAGTGERAVDTCDECARWNVGRCPHVREAVSAEDYTDGFQEFHGDVNYVREAVSADTPEDAT